MNIFYLGDVMGEAGISVVERLLPDLRREHAIDVVIAQAENVSDGKGLSVGDYKRLKKTGVDGFSGGNHTLSRPETLQLVANAEAPVTAPANMEDVPGPGYKYVGEGDKKVLLISLLGQVVGRSADQPTKNPLQLIDEILDNESSISKAAVVVNLHGDFSSEKVVFGHYVDGRVTVALGDHWHVPTADARVLPGGTAHMTDVGMCGALNSSLGVTYESIVPRWRDGKQTRNELETDPPYQLNGLLVSVNQDGLAETVEHIQRILKD